MFAPWNTTVPVPLLIRFLPAPVIVPTTVRVAAESLVHGLYNMIERMREVGGRGLIITSPGTGCRVEFMIPVSKSSEPVMETSEIGLPMVVGGKEVVS